ncbi:stage II sporulation protein M [Frigoribacterium sp. VKM Ac-2530]|uniref:stage II sporulation protein M n=1 Tax=Frigoribacterium sp. VKM Ac-2530 TaxID=2783822 RepID=UPI00188D509B|nr:stage II sporulation protein M [Frigoribacterium sp. VKM Ac-2530]MBF4578808.1 stage II sporulation protein M [Frigoribacterium sp. VKM Ac-2530]
MDLDAYAAAHGHEWTELEALARRRRLTGPEADELIRLYQSGAAELSALQTAAGPSVVADRLSLTLSRARLRFTGAGRNLASQVPTFFVAQLPAALWRVRWLSIAVLLVTVVVATSFAVWAAGSPAVLASFGSEEFRRQFATEDFVDYYSESAPSSFTGQVWTNNAFIAAQCVAFGITGVWVPYVVLNNAMNVGISAGLMAEQGRLEYFFLYILPHGQLELYSIFVAGGAGLMIFWSWVAPGARTRGQALAQDGRALVTVAVGLMLALLVSGVIEGFVTRQDWPWPIKIGIGTVALAGFLAYQWVLGGRAHRSGQTGDLDEFEAGATELVAG